MTKANWKEAPHDAETYEQGLAMGYKRFCKPGFYWSDLNNRWYAKPKGMTWSVLEHRPRIIAREDMREGMVVRCVDVKEGGDWYWFGKECRVGTDGDGYFGPLEEDGIFSAAPNLYTFEMVSEPEQDPQNWEVLIDSPESEEEEWTHTHLGRKCNLVHADGFKAWVIFEDGSDKVVTTHGLKSIEAKPTITKEQIEGANMLAEFLGTDGDTMQDFLCEYVCAEPADGPQW